MKTLINWFDHRTGFRSLTKEVLLENIPGGSRWRYVWGSTLTFALFVQFITGLFLWMGYSASSGDAWESVNYIQNEMTGGWLLRGIHHWMAQAMPILLLLHLMQVLVDGAYKAPREVNFWFGVILLKLVLALSLTGYLLPWDQLAIWAVTVGSNMARATPFLGHEGPGASLLAIGDINLVHAGSDVRFALLGGRFVGEATLLRFYVLHCIAVPFIAMIFMAVHFWRIRKDGGISGPM